VKAEAERVLGAVVGDRFLTARAGLIAGPSTRSLRTFRAESPPDGERPRPAGAGRGLSEVRVGQSRGALGRPAASWPPVSVLPSTSAATLRSATAAMASADSSARSLRYSR
jgi:hypothetical protein